MCFLRSRSSTVRSASLRYLVAATATSHRMHHKERRRQVVPGRKTKGRLRVAGSGPADPEQRHLPPGGETRLLNGLQKKLAPVLLRHGRRAGARHEESPLHRVDQLDRVPVQAVVLAAGALQRLHTRRQLGGIQDHHVEGFVAVAHVIGNVRPDVAEGTTSIVVVCVFVVVVRPKAVQSRVGPAGLDGVRRAVDANGARGALLDRIEGKASVVAAQVQDPLSGTQLGHVEAVLALVAVHARLLSLLPGKGLVPDSILSAHDGFVDFVAVVVMVVLVALAGFVGFVPVLLEPGGSRLPDQLVVREDFLQGFQDGFPVDLAPGSGRHDHRHVPAHHVHGQPRQAVALTVDQPVRVGFVGGKPERDAGRQGAVQVLVQDAPEDEGFCGPDPVLDHQVRNLPGHVRVE
mmetsp:Transcript_20272/g.56363  ORF Transcript_20272/g.56363 Transcript_20272/m.56363 type:complete len:404 (+) Transcript_20272:261-1472(+)